MVLPIFESIDDLTFYAQAYRDHQQWLAPDSHYLGRLGGEPDVHLHVWMMQAFFDNNAEELDLDEKSSESITFAAQQCAKEYGARPAALGMLYAWAKGVKYLPPNCIGVSVPLREDGAPRYVDLIDQGLVFRHVRPS